SLASPSPEFTLAATVATEDDVALAPFGASWAAAWRATDTSGLETLHVHQGPVSPTAKEWTVGPYLPGPANVRPALAELDGTLILVTFLEARDVEACPPTFSLRGAVLDVAGPDVVTDFEIVPTSADDSGVTSTDIRDFELMEVGDRVFAAWQSNALP